MVVEDFQDYDYEFDEELDSLKIDQEEVQKPEEEVKEEIVQEEPKQKPEEDQEPIETKEEEESEVSVEELLFKAGVEEGYLLLDDDYEYSSLEEALAEDAKNRTELIKQRLVESFPEEFRFFANAVINQGVTDVKTILEAMNSDTTEVVSEDKLSDDQARTILEKFYKKQEMDDDDIETIIDNLEVKDKLKKSAVTVLRKEAEVKQKEREEKIKNEVLKQQQEQEQRRLEAQKRAQEMQDLIASREQSSKVKQTVQNELFSGQTIEKVKQIFNQPDTAIDFSALVSRLFTVTKDNKVSLNMEALSEFAKKESGEAIKKTWKEKALGSKIKDLRVTKKSDRDELDDQELLD